MSIPSFLAVRSSDRRGGVNSGVLVFFGSFVVLGGLVAVLALNSRPARETRSQEPLVVFCAAGLKGPIEEIAREYEREFQTPIRLQFGGSQQQLAAMQVSKTGDLYIPADENYVTLARDKQLVRESISVATMRPVLAVKKGSAVGVASLDDLLSKDLRVAQANPDAAAVGKLTRDALRKIGKWEALEKKTTVFKPTVNEVANDIKVGAVDVGVVWDALVVQYPELEAIAIPELSQSTARLAVSICAGSSQPTAALRFARYVAARDKGLPAFARFGFQPLAGDPWSDSPEITLYAGSMLRPAIENTIAIFERREAVRVNCVYNGCGILVAQMKAGKTPDAYFACDQEFMQQVKDLFPDADEIARNQLVILVAKGNPHGVRTLKDLGNDGLRVGIGHEKQCAMGWLTQRTFEQSGVQTTVMKNVKVQTPTGDMLVNQMRARSLDAAVAYLSNAVGSGDFLDAIQIEGVPCSTAVQPFGIAKSSDQKQLVARLYEAIRSAESREQFLSSGFQWGGASAAPDAPKPDATKPDATKPDAPKPDATKPDAPDAGAKGASP